MVAVSCVLESALKLMKLLLSVNMKQTLKFLLLHLHCYTKRLLSTCNKEKSVQLKLLCTVAFHKQCRFIFAIKLNVNMPHSVFKISTQQEIKDNLNNVADSSSSPCSLGLSIFISVQCISGVSKQ